MDWTILAIIIQLIFLEAILSIDNAAVLGAMVSILPADARIKWPRLLSGPGKALNPVLGKQRTAALRVGLLGAYAGRGLMLVLASLVIHNPWLKLAGAAYLIRLALANLGVPEAGDAPHHQREVRAKSFWLIVLNVELADLVFSLDNVVAAVSLSNKLWVVMVGVAIGILAMRFAAGLFTIAVLREPVLKPAAYLLVMNIGIQLILEDLTGLNINDWTRFAVSVAILVLSLLYAHSKFLQKSRPALIWLAQGMDDLSRLINWVLSPLVALLRLAAKGIDKLTRKPGKKHLHDAKPFDK